MTADQPTARNDRGRYSDLGDQPTAGLDVEAMRARCEADRRAVVFFGRRSGRTQYQQALVDREALLDALEAVTRERDEARAALARVETTAEQQAQVIWSMGESLARAESACERAADVRLYGERGTPYRMGADAMALSVRAALATPEADR